MKTLLLVLVVLAVTGCGQEDGSGPPAEPAAGPGTTAATAPLDEPPKIEEGPPPAWIETEGGSYWLAHASYCWRAQCADYVGIADRDDVPTVRVRKGEVVRFHLGFDPRELSVSLEGSNVSKTLAPGRVAEWTVPGSGGVWLFAQAAPGQGGADASYVLKLAVGA